MFGRARENKKHTGAVPISDLFAKYKTRLKPPQGVVITAFCAAVETELGVPLARSQVRYSVHSRTISVQTSGPGKSEILFKKGRILAVCKEVLGESNSPKHIV